MHSASTCPACTLAGLAENKCLVRRPNGAQLMQVGEQEIALGAKFRARIVLEVEVRCLSPFFITSRATVSTAEMVLRQQASYCCMQRNDSHAHGPVRPEGRSQWRQEFWSGLPSRSNGNGASSSGRREEDTHIEPRSPLAAQPHDLTFTSIEGDFQVRPHAV